MFLWQRSQLFDEASDTGAGGGTATVTETPEQKELREVREENARLKRENQEANDSARQWSERALRATANMPTREELAAPAKTEATEEVIETGEQLLDDISKDGLAALKKRGFVSLADVQKLVSESIERAVGETRTEGQFQSVMSDEFPEMISDLARVDKGLKPETELFVTAAQIYNDAIALDPDLKGSKSALIMATRQAAAQLQLSGKRKVDEKQERDTSRRQRIEAQKPGDRGRGSDEPGDGELSAKQKQMAKDLGISEDKFKAQQARIRGERGK